jgi:8-oxo-dGTP pyrophosphatase MutT (NUDIX family)
MTSWDAAVVVLVKDGKVLGVTKGIDRQDINLPGGLRDPEDASPLDTATRELLEETGYQLLQAKPIASWFSKSGKYVIGFRGTRWTGRLRSSEEGQAAWVSPRTLLGPGCTHRGLNAGLLGRLAGR